MGPRACPMTPGLWPWAVPALTESFRRPGRAYARSNTCT